MFIAVIRTVILYVFVILAIRLMGKRQISDMQPSELVVTMMISDIASLPMQVSAVMLKSRLFRKLISGSPVVVIEDGRLLQRQLKRLRLTTDELCAQLRQQNVFSLQDVQYCIVETNGVLSVLEKPSKRVPNAEESGIVIPDNKMEAVVVSDGAWVESSLRLCGSTKQEINNILQKKQIELNEIFLMTMDGNGVCQIIRRENEK